MGHSVSVKSPLCFVHIFNLLKSAKTAIHRGNAPENFFLLYIYSSCDGRIPVFA